MKDLWDNLKESSLPVVLYGMGNGADKIINVLNEKDIGFIGVFSSDEFFKDGKTFHGFKVTTLKELEKKYGRMNILMCFGSARSEVIENVKKIRQNHNFFAPDVPVYGDILFDKSFFNSTKQRHGDVLKLLSDSISKKTFQNIIDYKLSGNVDYLFECEVSPNEPYTSFLKLTQNESYLDLGAYRGDTVFEFLNAVNGKYKKIYAVEPDSKTFKKLSETVKNIKNTELFCGAVSDKSGKGFFAMNGSRGSNVSKSGKEIDLLAVDDILSGKTVTYIKADVEGAELDFIKGAEKTIKNQRPKMQIACYHRSDDLINIPEAVLKLRSDYKIYMRHFPSLPAWDTVYYFI